MIHGFDVALHVAVLRGYDVAPLVAMLHGYDVARHFAVSRGYDVAPLVAMLHGYDVARHVAVLRGYDVALLVEMSHSYNIYVVNAYCAIGSLNIILNFNNMKQYCMCSVIT